MPVSGELPIFTGNRQLGLSGSGYLASLPGPAMKALLTLFTHLLMHGVPAQPHGMRINPINMCSAYSEKTGIVPDIGRVFWQNSAASDQGP